MHRHSESRRRLGFTMIELLVVIAVLGLLISMIAAIAGTAIYQQKLRNTQQIMQNTMLAIEQFATENPLRSTYDRYGQETFGKYPPYTLANATANGSIAKTMEPKKAGNEFVRPNVPDSLADRLYRDLGAYQPGKDRWVWLNHGEGENDDDGNNDIRALYAYMRAFSPEALKTIPEAQLKPIDPSANPEFINPTGNGTAAGNSGVVDVFGIHDAWGVPLDYMLYVKLEWGIKIKGDGTENTEWKITERRPVLRSRGIKREVYDEWVKSNSDPQARARILSPPEDWIFSEQLPHPWAGLSDKPAYRAGREPLGTMGGSPAVNNGWVRMVAQAEDYSYRPDGDDNWP